MKNILFTHFLLVTDLWSLLLAPTTLSFGILVKWTPKEFENDRMYFKYFWTINYVLKQCICLYALWIKIVGSFSLWGLKETGSNFGIPKISVVRELSTMKQLLN